MNLEDHLGDIIRKARAMNSVTPEAASRAAGLSPAELDALENSGQAPGNVDLKNLAQFIGLNANKLQSIADGWMPSPKDLGAWRELRTITTTAQGITVNCYLAWEGFSRGGSLRFA